MKIGKIFLSLIISIITFVIINYFLLVGIRLDNPAFWLSIIFSCSISTLIISIIEYKLKKGYNSTTLTSMYIVGAIGILVLGSVASMKIFHVQKYKNQIEIVQDGDFKKDIQTINTNIPVVDVETARMVGERTMGTLENYVSQFTINQEYNLIMYQGKQYRISPLEYGGLFKYFSNSKEGIPGYILVDVITQEAKFVKLEKGIKYSTSAFFNNNLKRYIRMKYPTKIFDKIHFEIDEEGTPYYIVPMGQNKIVFGGYKVEEVLVVNAITGETKVYGLDNIPEWIDHVYSLDYLMSKIESRLSLVNGLFNFSQKGVMKTSYSYVNEEFEGYNTIVNASNEIGFFTGVTSAASDESNLGFMIANCKTGKVTYYVCPGAEEASAQSSAKGLVQQYGYTASYPVIINVDGNETYFMTLKDSGRIIKKYALVNVRNYSIAVEADTISDVISKYNKRILGDANYTSNNKESTKKGVVSNINTAIIDGYTYYYISFEEDSNIYMSTITNSNLQVLLKVGDNVEINFFDSSEENVKTVTKITIN